MSEQRMTLAEKLLVIQRNIEKATKSASNPHFRSQYTDLNEVMAVAKPILNDAGIFITQSPGKDQFGAFVETSLINVADGQSLTGRVYFSGNEDNMQKIGAAITYARRFGLKTMLAMEDQDDDGETAVGRGKVESKQVTKKVAEASGSGSKAKQTAQVAKPGVAGTVPRAAILEAISSYSKVAVAKKGATPERLAEFLAPYGVKNKDELTDTQALAVKQALSDFVMA